jgi:polyferredoxin
VTEPAPARTKKLDPLSWRNARRLRRVVQLAAFAFFVVLLFSALQRMTAYPYADLFFRLDPLAALTAMLSRRAWLPHLELALATVVLTVVLGRVWCAWICPLGTLLEWFTFKRARRRAQALPPRLKQIKYVLLVVIVVMAALSSLTLMIIDPIALLTRTMTTSIIPALDYGVTRAESALYHFGFMQPRIDWFEQLVRGRVLPTVQPLYSQAVAIALVLLGIIALNALADRFWCRTLCPLGALLGLVSKIAILRPVVGEACTNCARCAKACPLDAIEVAPAAGREPTGPGAAALPTVASSECTVCLDCLVACPSSMSYGITLRPSPWREYDPGRREFLYAAATGVGAVLLAGTGVWNKLVSPGLLRPPGVTSEATFLSSCIRCSQCMKVCPTSGLQPTLAEAGVVGFWSPVLKPRLGYCDYSCTACGHICPTGAIPRLPLERKRKQVLGKVVIDRNRCLPWSQDTPCVVCQEVCPIPKKAIRLTERRLKHPVNYIDSVQLPSVVVDRCIGCGICEYQCPVSGTAAITVQHWVPPEAALG